MNKILFYKDKPVFGLDIGYGSLKIMQMEMQHGKPVVVGYGVNFFDPSAVKDNVITDFEKIAQSVNDLFKNRLVGDITTNRIVMAVPAAATFSRTFTIPKVELKDLKDAVKLEIEQYIPVPVDDLFFDHLILRRTETEIDILSVAAPKRIINAYMQLADILGLEVAAIDATTGATGRLFMKFERSDVPTVLIDLGSTSSDLTIFDKTLVVTGSAPGGGDSFTNAIATKLSISKDEAQVVKTKYGLGASKKQKEIIEALDPIISQIIKEIKQMIRYHQERSGSTEMVSQILTMGGGANMPGLAEYLTDKLRVPVRLCDPWHHLEFSGKHAPEAVERSMYVTVAGLAAVTPQELAE